MSQITLRAWQREALDAFAEHGEQAFLAVACPGAGKTTFALAATRRWLGGERRPVIVVVPTQHLKKQWAHAALRFGFHLDSSWSASDGPPASDMHGVVVTYAQTSTSANELAAFGTDGIVILDEVHHAAAERSWGDGVKRAFASADTRLLLSGTPFRTDDNPIPFVRYSWGDYGDAEADYEYGYGEALSDGGVVRPVYFPRFDGHMEWMNAEGELVEATFDDDLKRSEWGARLRTALSVDGEWIKTVLGQADQQLREIRETHPNAGGLAIAIDHEHARGIADLLRLRHGVEAKIALSDDPRASDVIQAFADGDDPWIVAVRMISEGVDIPRLRLGVFATTTTTPMFFRQAVGRIARWTPGIRKQKAYMYLPDDARLRGHAANLATQRRHSIELRKERAAEEGEFDSIGGDRQEEQLSLFAALSSTVLTDVQLGEPTTPLDGIDPTEEYVALAGDLEGYPVNLPPPPPLPGRDAHVDGETPAAGGTRAEAKQSLRELNASRVRELVARTGQEYPAINRQLNDRAGIGRITEATVAQLDRRAAEAKKWLEQLT